MKFLSSFLIFILFTFKLISQNDTIGGVINNYQSVSLIKAGPCFDTLFVPITNDFSIEDKVLIIQMQGASASTANNTTFGDLINFNNAGNFEFSKVAAIDNNYLVLSTNLSTNFSPSGNIQVISVPVYKNAIVNETLKAKKWDGTTGGVFAIEVQDSLILLDNISADSTGFRGGRTFTNQISHNNSFCNRTVLFSSPGIANGGEKGEAVAVVNINQSVGRGHFANGGGGGNSTNAGGGGGGNAGSGGIGGNEWSNCTGNAIGGFGGQSISSSNSSSKVFLGGGGGGGESNNLQGTDGGAGGGIVFITSENLIANGFSISANGGNAETAGADGAGGGGGGGTILFNVKNVVGTLNIESKGGKGGDNTHTTSCVAPGGGGGGGLIQHRGNSLQAGINANISGGANGLSTNPTQSCFNTGYGASPGNDGLVLNDLVINVPLNNNTFQLLENDTTLCSGNTIDFDISLANATYLWSDGSTNPTFTIKDSGIYWLDITLSGCIFRDSIVVKLKTKPLVNLGIDSTYCEGSILAPDSIYPSASYTWSNGSNNNSISIIDLGIYWLESFLDGCYDRDSILIDINPTPTIDLGNDQVLCDGESITLFGNQPGLNLIWSDGSNNSSLLVDKPGIYWLEGSNLKGCKDRDSVKIDFEDCDCSFNVPNIFTPNNDFINDVFMPDFDCEPVDYNVKIYNRWGQKSFESNRVDYGWDGRVSGIKASEGIYFYVIEYRIKSNQKMNRLTGSLFFNE